MNVRTAHREHSSPRWCSRKVIPSEAWRPRLMRYTTAADSSPAIQHKAPQGAEHQQVHLAPRYQKFLDLENLPTKQADKPGQVGNYTAQKDRTLKELTEAESQECPTCYSVGMCHQRDGPGSHSRIKSIPRPLAHRDFKRKQKEQGTTSHP